MLASKGCDVAICLKSALIRNLVAVGLECNFGEHFTKSLEERAFILGVFVLPIPFAFRASATSVNALTWGVR